MRKKMSEAEKIFKEVREIINRNLNQRPVLFERSQFKKDFDELEKKYLKKIKEDDGNKRRVE
jgi:hypothetical protein